jgi:hypothetical protein
MSPPDAVSDATALDHILGLQITVAWAGEAGGSPKRLGWWDTDFVDPLAGGDLFRRLLPKTAPWATLEAVRRAATQKDDAARQRLGQPDAAMTLFHWGFVLDEQLRERLSAHKRHGTDPSQALPSLRIREPFERAEFESFLTGLCPLPETQSEPGGRRIVRPAAQSSSRASELARVLVPLTSQYPMPYWTRTE